MNFTLNKMPEFTQSQRDKIRALSTELNINPYTVFEPEFEVLHDKEYRELIFYKIYEKTDLIMAGMGRCKEDKSLNNYFDLCNELLKAHKSLIVNAHKRLIFVNNVIPDKFICDAK